MFKIRKKIIKENQRLDTQNTYIKTCLRGNNTSNGLSVVHHVKTRIKPILRFLWTHLIHMIIGMFFLKRCFYMTIFSTWNYNFFFELLNEIHKQKQMYCVLTVWIFFFLKVNDPTTKHVFLNHDEYFGTIIISRRALYNEASLNYCIFKNSFVELRILRIF